MEKLEVERLLGEWLGPRLGERTYAEELYLEAEADDAVNKVTTDDVQTLTALEEHVQALGYSLFLTKAQFEAAHYFIPFFRRQCIINGCIISYEVYAQECLKEYKPVADRLIREGKVVAESIDICRSDETEKGKTMTKGKTMVSIWYSTFFTDEERKAGLPELEVAIDEEAARNFFKEMRPEVSNVDEKINAIKMLEIIMLEERPCNPWEVYDAIVRFIS